VHRLHTASKGIAADWRANSGAAPGIERVTSFLKESNAAPIRSLSGSGLPLRTSRQEPESTARQRHDSDPEEQASTGSGCDWDHLTSTLNRFFLEYLYKLLKWAHNSTQLSGGARNRVFIEIAIPAHRTGRPRRQIRL